MHLNGRSSPEGKSEALAFDLLCSYTVKMVSFEILGVFVARTVVLVTHALAMQVYRLN